MGCQVAAAAPRIPRADGGCINTARTFVSAASPRIYRGRDPRAVGGFSAVLAELTSCCAPVLPCLPEAKKEPEQLADEFLSEDDSDDDA